MARILLPASLILDRIGVQMTSIPIPESAFRLAVDIRAAGGRAWLVGGSVRDALLGRPPSDVDIEVHGLGPDALSRLLQHHGRVKPVGRSFGVFRLVIDRHTTFEISLPRPDSRGGARGELRGQPDIGIEQAARRRDLTVNAIAWDPLTQELADPCGGVADLEQRRLQACDPATFADDPLRAWRVAGLSARLGFAPTPELVALCQEIDVSAIAAERVRAELDKLLLRGARPSVGMRVAWDAGLIARQLPELSGLDLTRLCEALDRAAQHRAQVGPEPRDLALMLGALLHGVSGEALEQILDRLLVHTWRRYPLRQRVRAAVQLWPELARPVTDARLLELAEDAEIAVVAEVAWAAGEGAVALANRARAAALGVEHDPLPPLIQGRHLQGLGVGPGKAMGELLARVRAAQLAGTVHDLDGALAFVNRLLHQAQKPPSSSGAGGVR